MDEPSGAPTYRSLSGALERIGRVLETLSRPDGTRVSPEEIQGSREALDHLSGALSDLYSERAYDHLLAEPTRDRDFASWEIEKRARPSPDGAPDPVFIIGHWRSGTTLLAWLLDSHPRFAAVPENHLLVSLCGLPAVPREPFRTPLLPLVWAYQSVQFLGEERMAYFSRYGRLVEGIYGEYAARRGKPRWVGKELFLHDALDALDLLFGYRARFLYIHRHGLDAALSASERFGSRDGAPQAGGGSFDLETYLTSWVRQNERLMDFHERNPGRCARIPYEELVASPESEGRRLCAFLGEKWPDTILQDMQRQDHPEGLGDNRIFETGGRIHGSRGGRWKDLPPAIVRQLGRLADPVLARLGYEPVSRS